MSRLIEFSWLKSFLIQCLMLFIITKSSTSTIPMPFTTPTPSCDCSRVRPCTPFTSLLLRRLSDHDQDVVYAMTRSDSDCPFLVSCCPTLRAPAVHTTTPAPWVWDRRPYRADESRPPVSTRFATITDNLGIKSNAVDLENPLTYHNFPHAFYENDASDESLFGRPQEFHQLHRQQANFKFDIDDAHYDEERGIYVAKEDDDSLLLQLQQQQQQQQKQQYRQPPSRTYAPNGRSLNKGPTRLTSPIIYPDDDRLHEQLIFSTTDGRATPGPSRRRISTTRPSTSAGFRPVAPSVGAARARRPLINAPDCGVSVDTRIRGGAKAQSGQFPWITRIGYFNTSSNRVSYRCSGSVISEHYVLTAAHCVTNLVPNLQLYHVLIGDMEISPECRRNPSSCDSRQTFNIVNITIHADYDRPKFANDIALLRITRLSATSAASYGTICLPLDNSASSIKRLTGQTGIVAGWSTSHEGVEITSSPRVKYLRLPIVNTTECAINYAKYSENFKDPIVITPSQLCAQGQPMNDVCRGDSGGPFMDDGSSGLFNGPGRYTLLGIVAFGPTICGASNFPGVYTRVSSYVDWIVASIS